MGLYHDPGNQALLAIQCVLIAIGVGIIVSRASLAQVLLRRRALREGGRQRVVVEWALVAAAVVLIIFAVFAFVPCLGGR